MAKVIARISGVALRPGMSANRRVYTPDAIARMAARAQKRIASGDGPAITMLTHHEAGDSSTAIVGRLTSMTVGDDGEARFSADIADTPDGRVIASLLDTSDGEPAFLRNVSIRGNWAGSVRNVRGPDGKAAETSDDISLDGVDFTRSPGVHGASVNTFEWRARTPVPTESRLRRAAITESAPPALVLPAPERSKTMSDKKLRKLVDRAVREALRQPGVREALTASAAPQPTPSTGLAPSAATAPEPARPLPAMDANELHDYATEALRAHGRASGFRSPYWQQR